MEDYTTGVEKKRISAHELSDYGYCSVSWLLGRRGFDAVSPEIEAGKAKHASEGEKAEELLQTMSIAKALLALVPILVIIGIGIALWRLFF